MAYALFTENNYTYFGKNDKVDFYADNTHYHLFDYITKDLSGLPKLLEQYIVKKINTTTFELKEQANSAENINKIKEILVSAHPYYAHEYRKVIINAIGNYFNELLVYSCYHLKVISDQEILEKDWYTARITALMEPLLQVADKYPAEFYDKLREKIVIEAFGIDESFIIDIIQPIGFKHEIKTQTSAYNMLYFILDISAPNIKELTLPQRIWLFGNIFYGRYNYSAEMSFNQQFTFWHPARRQYGYADIPDSENDEKINETFNMPLDFRRLNIGRDGIPSNLMEYFNNAVKNAKTITTTATINERYEINDLSHLLYLEIIFMIKSSIMIRKCKNCGKYFVVNNRKIVYCDRIDESGAYCSAVGPNRSFQQKLKEDDALNIYTRAYKTHFARVRKNKMTQENFEDWCNKAKEKLNQVRSGMLDISIFQEWLKK